MTRNLMVKSILIKLTLPFLKILSVHLFIGKNWLFEDVPDGAEDSVIALFENIYLHLSSHLY
ncbi:MAG: hypothetical protein KDK54_16735 [Leptospiraceae bacterium]|nr:hypothetical protein [Leptospiraceae bacterium]